MKENEEKNKVSNRKGWSIFGFLISILLLTIAIILSMNEEKATREAKISDRIINSEVKESIEQTSSELSKTVNQVQSNENNQSDKKEENEQFIMPVEGEISSGYSIDNLQYSNTLQEWITHRGIDIKADKTTVVKASKSGTVKYIKEDPRYGLSITIEHSDGFQTVYSSLLSSEFVKEGDKVEQGQSIGTVGNSAVFESADGSHLHFEILKDGEYVNPDIYLK